MTHVYCDGFVIYLKWCVPSIPLQNDFTVFNSFGSNVLKCFAPTATLAIFLLEVVSNALIQTYREMTY